MLGYQWRGGWQARAVAHICEHQYTALKGPRQFTGKTFIAGNIIGSYYLFHGYPVIGVFPTMRGGSHILVEGIEAAMERIERQTAGQLYRVIDNRMYKKWSNGARLHLVSSDEAAEVEGLTGACILWDEAHRAEPERLAKIEPFVATYTPMGIARVILYGIGGSKRMLLGRKWRDGSYSPCHITPAEIIQEQPALEEQFKRYKLSLGDILYNQHFEGIDEDETERTLLPYINKTAEYMEGFPPERVFALDVGRVSDETILGIFERRPAKFAGDNNEMYKALNLVEVVKIPRVQFPNIYTDKRTGRQILEHERHHIPPEYVDVEYGQAQYIYDAIMEWKPQGGAIMPEQVRMERNAIGEGLYDELSARYFPGLSSVYMSNQQTKDIYGAGMKDRLIGQLRTISRAGLFGCYDDSVRQHLSDLRYNVTDKEGAKMIDVEHSDILSMVLVGISGYDW
jgi:hypothetical protein